ncbi:MAG: hypothetical protein RLZZ419_781, partial [Pseudomonadota bacterium]
MINQKMPDFMPAVSTARPTRAMRNHYTAYQRLAAIYLLRLALGLQKHIRQRQLCHFFEDDLGRITGLDEYHCTGDAEDFDDDDLSFSRSTSKAALVKSMRQQLSKLLEEGVGPNEFLFDNIRLLGNTLKLNLVEQEILVLRLLMPLLQVFQETVISYCGICSMQSTVDYLRLMTTRPAREILKALQPNSQLQQMGWIKIHSGLVDLEDKLILADGLVDIMLRQHDSAEALLANFFRPSSPTKLILDDYGHLQNDLNVLQPYLRAALDEKQRGVNILIYGPPGVGKTQFAKLLAQTVNASLFEVLCSNQDGNVLRGSARFAACNLSQKLLNKSHDSLLLFDEAEDVFPSRHSFFFDDDDEGQSGGQGDKAWINQQLENNPVPVLWI